jgi:hypothetical protein
VDIALIAPPALVVGAAGITAVLLRRLSRAIDELRAAERRNRRLQEALIPVRAETRRVGATVERMTRR